MPEKNHVYNALRPVADTGGGGQRGCELFDRPVKIWYQISQFALFRSKWNKETHQYISI